MARPLADRIKYGFCRVHRPVLDDAPLADVRHHGAVPRLGRGQPPDSLPAAPTRRTLFSP
jgi:hypothetical protein